MATIIKMGPDGPAFAGMTLGLPSYSVSGAPGNGAQLPVGQDGLREDGMIGVPAPTPTAKKEKAKFIPNMLRVAVEEKWGHPYGYFDALVANNLDERHVLYKGQQITIPARAKRAKVTLATRWRRRFGSS